MALINCPECGKEISDKAVACINCGFPLSQLPKNNRQAAPVIISKDCIPGRPIDAPVATEPSINTSSPKVSANNNQPTVNQNNKSRELTKSFAQWITNTPANNSSDPYRLVCAKCNSSNIKFEVEHVNQVVGAKSEVRKKSIVTRTGNRMGRSTMMLLTGGLWGLVPKRSDYNEITKVQTQTFEYKTAVCQNCGYSWQIF